MSFQDTILYQPQFIPLLVFLFMYAVQLSQRSVSSYHSLSFPTNFGGSQLQMCFYFLLCFVGKVQEKCETHFVVF